MHSEGWFMQAGMLPPYLRVMVAFLIALIPSMMAVVILWHFDALDKGVPLIVVLMIPGLGWYVTHRIKMTLQEREPRQDGSDSDPPPMYEKVISEPPPYEILYMEKSTTSPTMSTISDKLSPEYDCRDLASMHTDTTSIFPTDDNRLAATTVSVCMEHEPLMSCCALERDRQKFCESDDDFHDPDLPSYRQAIMSTSKV